MKAKVLVEFYDLKADEIRSVGDTFDLSPERFEEIIKRGGEWLEEVKTTPKKAGAKNDGGRTNKA